MSTGYRTAFGIPDGLRPLAVVAGAWLAGPEPTTDEAIAERDSRPRERLPLEQIAFGRALGNPARLARFGLGRGSTGHQARER